MVHKFVTDKDTFKEIYIALPDRKTIFTKLFGLSNGILARKQEVSEINLSDFNSIIFWFQKISLLKGNSVEEIQIARTDLIVTTQSG